jgi:hypothetical protein
MAVQIAALAAVIGNAVARVEFEFACDGEHDGLRRFRKRGPAQAPASSLMEC